MRLRTALLSALILLAAASPAASQTGAGESSWTKFADAGFSALFPSEPPPFTYREKSPWARIAGASSPSSRRATPAS
ncbi:MAG TPA: hypothetical protein VF240_18925 [Pyrinomonadaceae bacterium]